MVGEQDRAFFEPFWRRIAVLAVLLAWLAWEWSNGDNLWGTLVAGLTVYFVWAYFITFPGKPKTEETHAKAEPGSEE